MYEKQGLAFNMPSPPGIFYTFAYLLSKDSRLYTVLVFVFALPVPTAHNFSSRVDSFRLDLS